MFQKFPRLSKRPKKFKSAQQLKNCVDSSNVDDFRAKWIAAIVNFFSKMFERMNSRTKTFFDFLKIVFCYCQLLLNVVVGLRRDHACQISITRAKRKNRNKFKRKNKQNENETETKTTTKMK